MASRWRFSGNAVAWSTAFGRVGVQTPGSAPPCKKCLFFRVSWDPGFPNSCTQFGIKSRELPSVVVFRTTGRHCPSFELNPKIKS